MHGSRLTFLALVFAAAMAASGLGGALHRAIGHSHVAHTSEPTVADTGHASQGHGCCTLPPASDREDRPSEDGPNDAPQQPSPTHDCDLCAVLGVLTAPAPDDGITVARIGETSVPLLLEAVEALSGRSALDQALPRGPPLSA